MQMAPRRPAAVSAETDDLPGLNFLVRRHESLKQMAVDGLEPAVVPYDHHVAVTVAVELDDPDDAVKRGANRILS